MFSLVNGDQVFKKKEASGRWWVKALAMKIWQPESSVLSENIPLRLMYLKTCSTVGGAVWGG